MNAVFLAATTLLTAAPVWACSLEATYVPPTNYELVDEADAIVVAEALRQVPGNPTGLMPTSVELRVVETLKGPYRVGQLVNVPGGVGSYHAPRKTRSFLDGRSMSSSSCLAYDYDVGRRFVLFLEKGTILRHPFSRINEEADPAWIEAVKRYAEIAALGDDAKEKAALMALRDRAGDALKEDITDHFRRPTAAKSFADLELLYQATQDPGGRELVLAAVARGAKPEASAFMRARLAEARAAAGPPEVVRMLAIYFRRVPDQEAFAELAVLYRPMWPVVRRDIARAISERGEVGLVPAMEALLDAADADDAAELAPFFIRHPSPKAIARIRALMGGKLVQRGDLARLLAAMGDAEILDWAKKRLAREPSPTQRPTNAVDFETAGLRGLAVGILAHSPRPEAEALVLLIIAERREDFVDLLEALETVHHPRAEAWLRTIAALKLNPRERAALDRSLKFRRP